MSSGRCVLAKDKGVMRMLRGATRHFYFRGREQGSILAILLAVIVMGATACDHVYFRDFRGIFAISYKQDRKGRLLNFREGSEQKYRFDFPDSGEIVTTDNLSDIDEKLLGIFMKRVEELG
jgi:hypothetical protein